MPRPSSLRRLLISAGHEPCQPVAEDAVEGRPEERVEAPLDVERERPRAADRVQQGVPGLRRRQPVARAGAVAALGRRAHAAPALRGSAGPQARQKR